MDSGFWGRVEAEGRPVAEAFKISKGFGGTVLYREILGLGRSRFISQIGVFQTLGSILGAETRSN